MPTPIRSMPICLIIACGGQSSRFGSNKLLQPLDGLPVFLHSVRTLAPLCRQTILAVPPALMPDFKSAAAEQLPTVPLTFVAGGSSRTASVRNALALVPDAPDSLVAVHDGARPLASADLLQALAELAQLHGAAIPAAPVTDTVKVVTPSRVVLSTPDRSTLVAVQTPQLFSAPLLKRAYSSPAAEATDDAALVEALGHPVHVLLNSAPNPKITFPSDLSSLPSHSS